MPRRSLDSERPILSQSVSNLPCCVSPQLQAVFGRCLPPGFHHNGAYFVIHWDESAMRCDALTRQLLCAALLTAYLDQPHVCLLQLTFVRVGQLDRHRQWHGRDPRTRSRSRSVERQAPGATKVRGLCAENRRSIEAGIGSQAGAGAWAPHDETRCRDEGETAEACRPDRGESRTCGETGLGRLLSAASH
jgi:hypothetical protein